MRLFRRDRTPPPETLGAGTALTVDVVEGQLVSVLTWTRELRRVVDGAVPALTVLRDAGFEGTVQLRAGDASGAVRGDVRLRTGPTLGIEVEPGGGEFVLVLRRGAQELRVTGVCTELEPLPGLGLEDPHSIALAEVVLTVAAAVAEDADDPVALPAPLAVTQANLQLLAETDDLPERWCACLFVTRAHDVPPDADDVLRTALWIEHTEGVKVHLDGSVADDPSERDDPGADPHAALATLEEWAGTEVDLGPYARWLAERTQEWLGMTVPGLSPTGR
ncbi:hypothetical protein [Cellulomonas iranensis]|uniref:hypothetical protein n=1 Tax=Cellulomonas iranensis TaxID=76862 RepID=UPI003D7CA63D